MIVCFMNSNGIVNVWFTIIFSSLKNAILNLFHVRVYILLDTQIMKNNKLEILCFFFFWEEILEILCSDLEMDEPFHIKSMSSFLLRKFE